MLRILLALALTSTALHAAVIRGTVVENQTGKPLLRARVTLLPIAGSSGEQSVRTNRYGSFEFLSLAAGTYVLKASRRGFMPAEYGQRAWNSAGIPVSVEDTASEFLSMRMRRYGAITGTVRDENDVGRAAWPVVAYRNTQPLQMAASAISDERGRYRIPGLEPGVYLARTASMQDDDAGYLPTFGQETLEAGEARLVRVYPEEDSREADVRPIPGKLFTLGGIVFADTPGIPLKITLVSDAGRQTRDAVTSPSGTPFQFGALPPGDYELYAEAQEVQGISSLLAFYMPLALVRDVPDLKVPLAPTGATQFLLYPRQMAQGSLVVAARRKDLAGVGPAEILKLSGNRAVLGPGRWEFMLTPPDGYYVSGFSGRFAPRGSSRPDGWNESRVDLNGGSAIFTLSSGPGGVHGVVKSAGEPVAGAPVYLEGYDPIGRKRTLDLRVARTDKQGAYKVEGLAPGAYRILATFEYLMPDVEAMDYAGARQLQVDARSDAPVDLELYGLR